MNLEFILPLVTFWHTITSQIATYSPPEITNNAVSLIHSVSFIAHYNYDFNMNYAVHASIAFFIYDLLYIMRRIFVFYRHKRDHREDPHPHPHQHKQTHKDELNKQLPFIVHHLAGIHILYSAITNANGHFILDAFLILEKSNIMIYVSYHLHKQYREYKRANVISEFVQLITYTYYRLFTLSIFIYNHHAILFTYPFMTQLFILLVYSMGYAWSYRLLMINIRNYFFIRTTAPQLPATAASRKYSSAG